MRGSGQCLAASFPLTLGPHEMPFSLHFGYHFDMPDMCCIKPSVSAPGTVSSRGEVQARAWLASAAKALVVWEASLSATAIATQAPPIAARRSARPRAPHPMRLPASTGPLATCRSSSARWCSRRVRPCQNRHASRLLVVIYSFPDTAAWCL